MKFLKILEKKGVQHQETNDIDKEVVPALMMAHKLAESICESKEKISKLALALDFADSQKKERELAAKFPEQYGQIVNKTHTQLEAMAQMESKNEEQARLLALALAKVKRKAELDVSNFEDKGTQVDRAFMSKYQRNREIQC